jgi:hypothetical protein
MSLRIGFDLDGVLADKQSALVREAETLFGPRDRPPDPQTEAAAEDIAETASEAADEGEAPTDAAGESELPDRQPLTARQQRKLWKHVARIDGFWEGLTEIEPGAVARLAALAAEHRWNVIFLTQRPETAGHTAQRQTQHWLERHGFSYPSVFIVPGSARGRVADALSLDIVVEFRPWNCLELAVDSWARPVLVWRDRAAPVPPNITQLGIVVADSVTQCLDVLSEARGAGARRGILERLKGMLSVRG